MNEEKIIKITEIVKEIYEENPDLLKEKRNSKDWYEKRFQFLEYNQKILNLLIEKLEDEIVNQEELFNMQKLFLLYPKKTPKKLLSLSWENIKTILGLCDLEKRKFYTDISYYLELNNETLKKYILNDLYEKVIFLINEIQDYNVINDENFLEKVLKIYPLVYET